MPRLSAGTAGIGLILQEDQGSFIVKQLVKVSMQTERAFVCYVCWGWMSWVCLCNPDKCAHTHVLQGGSAEHSGKISPGDRIKEVRVYDAWDCTGRARGLGQACIILLSCL